MVENSDNYLDFSLFQRFWSIFDQSWSISSISIEFIDFARFYRLWSILLILIDLINFYHFDPFYQAKSILSILWIFRLVLFMEKDKKMLFFLSLSRKSQLFKKPEEKHGYKNKSTPRRPALSLL